MGNAIKAFASENATVVVGTVIDMEMSDELRVTLVATGIGAERKPEISLVSNRSSGRYGNEANDFKLQSAGAAEKAAQPQEKTASMTQSEEKAEQNNDLEYLDIPAFLRKQAD